MVKDSTLYKHIQQEEEGGGTKRIWHVKNVGPRYYTALIFSILLFVALKNGGIPCVICRAITISLHKSKSGLAKTKDKKLRGTLELLHVHRKC